MNNTVIDLNEAMERVIAKVPPALAERANKVAEKNRAFWLFGKPSRAAVIRAALVYFFSMCVSDDDHLDITRATPSDKIQENQ